MSTHPAIKELRTMQTEELRKDFRSQQTIVRKMRIELTLNTEKDSARYRRERKHLARLQTILTEKTAQGLKQTPKSVTVSAPSPAKAVTAKSPSKAKRSSK